MPYIIGLTAVIGIVVLQMTGAIPMDAVGGGLVIAAATFAAALAIAVHEAWTKKRGVLGWIVNIVVSFAGAFLAAQFGGPLVAIPLLMLVGGGGTSLAAAGEGVMSVALVLIMVVTLAGSSGALWLVNRRR
ncbi:hypothetical protein KUL72_07450 [Bradyrhizobium arachidis]|uniref:hypothetical protein n=1 Tax=Bradyrhizobium TaxID=374 RepID=UPI00188C2044|nr:MULTISPECIES: hypothetical protein [Bradyrhizobium]MDN4986474.1 hypothetical protein [Bradyrhizobium sp. WYCCWR 13022]QOZ54901.1 hypothetical protein XH90_28595 [Bradyrhizobium sp. CCBAU 53338]UVO38195.1 hypothetical protein KUL72_07450 [Bradyrhizobium arachidis]